MSTQPDEVQESPGCGTRFGMFMKSCWRSVIIVTLPIVLLPVPIIGNTPEYRCMYVVLIMSIFWITESLPLEVTSMLPIVLFPTLGILDSDKTCRCYAKGANMMFMGGLMLAQGLQYSKLHKRIALKIILLVGCSHRKLNIGLSFATMFISMWISNSATTSMVAPITEAILEVLEQQNAGIMYHRKDPAIIAENLRKNNGVMEVDDLPKPSRTTTCHFISLAYASSIGGTSTLIGTGANPSFKGIYEAKFPLAPQIDFFEWILYNVPPMLLMLGAVCMSLQFVFMGLFRPKSEDAKGVNLGGEAEKIAKAVVQEQYNSLGAITWHESMAAFIFIVAIILYFTRSPGFIMGWANVLWDKPGKIKDAVTSLVTVLLMFSLPARLDFIKFFKSGISMDDLPKQPSSGIVTWKLLNDKMPWALMFLLGGGFALAAGSQMSGMSALIGQSLKGLKVLPPVLIVLVVIVICELLTEFSANVAISNIILPVLAEMAIAIEIHPMYLMLPATIACSMAFHMPVGTPPNAIVAGIANIKTSDMAIAGILPTILTSLIIWLSFITWGTIVYPEATTFPDWAKET